MHCRVANKDDLDFALWQTCREGWDTPRELFEVCLRHDREGFLIAEIENRPVGMVTATRFPTSGWIGNLITVPEYRGQGIGRYLLLQAMVYLQHPGIRTIRLEADPPGVPLYQSIAFIDEFESLRFTRTVSDGPAQINSCEPLSSESLAMLSAWDAERFGDDRGPLLRSLHRHASAGFIVRDGDAIDGYAMVWPSEIGARIGPWVATDAATAERLLKAALGTIHSGRVIVAIPRGNAVGIELLQRNDFERAASCRRMWWGDPGSHGVPTQVYGIANGTMG